MNQSKGAGGADDVAGHRCHRDLLRSQPLHCSVRGPPAAKPAADGDAKTATLELTPRQAEMMALANKMGEIVLTLRSVADMNSDAARAGGMDLTKREQGNAVKVLRYGAKSRVYGVN